MPADPLDKQLVEAVLTRPRRAKADVEEAKMAGLRPSRASATAVADSDEDDDDEDLDLPVAADEEETVEVVVELAHGTCCGTSNGATSAAFSIGISLGRRQKGMTRAFSPGSWCR